MMKYFLMAPSLGIMVGAAIAAKMLKTGRRKALLLFTLVGAVGSFLSVFDEYFLMVFGKFLFGVGAGVCITVAPRVLEETIPHKYFDKYGFGAMTNVGVDIMILTATILVMFMPKKGHKHVTEKVLAESTLYKWLYLAPVPLFGIAFILAVMCFRRESVGFYIHKKDKVNSIRALRQIFMGRTPAEYAKQYKKMIDSDAEHPEEDAAGGLAGIKKGFDVNFKKEAEEKEKEAKEKLKEKEEKAEDAVKKEANKVKDEAKKDEKDLKEGGEFELMWFEGGTADAEKDADKAKADAEKAKADAEKKKAELEKEAKARAEKLKKEAEAKLKKEGAKELAKYLPPWLLGTPGHPGGAECLIDRRYREATWLCLMLAFFNVMSGLTTILIYLHLIFEQADKKPELYTLTPKQMASGLAFALSAGAAASAKLVDKLKRKQMFCLSHFMIGVLLCLAGKFLQIENGLATFACIWAAQFWLQILTAPLFIYQTEVLQNNALSMATAWRSVCFTGLKLLVINVVTSRDPVVYIRLYELLYFFGLMQLLAVGVIYHLLAETQGLTKKQKANLLNPDKREKAAAKLRRVKAVEDEGTFVDEPFKAKDNEMVLKLAKFVDDSFKEYGLNPETDSLNKEQVQLLLANLMYKHGDKTLNNYHLNQRDFDKLFDLFEEDEATDAQSAD